MPPGAGTIPISHKNKGLWGNKGPKRAQKEAAPYRQVGEPFKREIAKLRGPNNPGRTPEINAKERKRKYREPVGERCWVPIKGLTLRRLKNPRAWMEIPKRMGNTPFQSISTAPISTIKYLER